MVGRQRISFGNGPLFRGNTFLIFGGVLLYQLYIEKNGVAQAATALLLWFVTVAALFVQGSLNKSPTFGRIKQAANLW